MDRIKLAPSASYNDVEELLPTQMKLIWFLAISCSLMSIPFVIKGLVQAHYLMVVALLLFMGSLLTSASAIRKRRLADRHFYAVLLSLSASIFLGIKAVGAYSMFWAFPSAVAFIFFLPLRRAVIANATILLATTLSSALFIEPGMALRLFASLLFTMLICRYVHDVIADLQFKLEQESIRDPLTRAFNRRQLGLHLEQSLKDYHQHRRPASLLALDVDHFKKINDRFGHSQGDTVLVSLVNLIKQSFHEDVALFRTGGEEFIVLLPDHTAEQVQNRAEQLRQQIQSTAFISDWPITVSIGLLALEPAIQHAEQWLTWTDEALYQAKRDGRNQIRYYRAS